MRPLLIALTLLLPQTASADPPALRATLMPSGRSVLLEAPAPITATAGSPILTGGPAPTVLGQVVTSDPAFPARWRLYPLSIPPPADAELTLSVPAGAFTTAAGPNAAAELPVARAGAEFLPDPLAGPRSMSLGYQPWFGAYWSPGSLYANLAKATNPDWGDYQGGNDQKWNGGMTPDGYPTGAAVTPCNKYPVMQNGADQWITNHYVTVEPGRVDLLWDGTADAVLLAGPNTTLTERPAPGPGHRVYDVSLAPGEACPYLRLTVDTTGGKTLANVRIFDRNVPDPLNPPRFHPRTLAQLRGVKGVRFKDCWANDDCPNVATLADFPTEASAGWAMTRHQEVRPTRVEAVNSGPWCRDGHWQVLVTFDRPLQVAPGTRADIWCTPSDGSHVPVQAFDLRYQDGTTVRTGLGGLLYPLDGTHAVLAGCCDDKPVASTDLPAGAYLHVLYTSAPAAAPFQLARELGLEWLWVSLPFTMTDAGIADLARLAATEHPRGCKLHVEWSNECWNFVFPQTAHLKIAAAEFAWARNQAGDASWQIGSAETWYWFYVARSAQAFRAFKTAWVAAGRDAGELEFPLNSQAGWPLITERYLSYAATHDPDGRRVGDPGFTGRIEPTELATSLGYLTPHLAGDPATLGALTLEQLMDACDAVAAHYADADAGVWFKGQADVVAGSAFPRLPHVFYEGGPARLILDGADQATQDRDTVAWSFHPRLRRQWLTTLRYWEGRGVKLYSKYGSTGVLRVEGGKIGSYYSYVGIDQVAGRGDGTDGLTDNRPLLAGADGRPARPDLSRAVSPVGLAVLDWLASPTDHQTDPGQPADPPPVPVVDPPPPPPPPARAPPGPAEFRVSDYGAKGDRVTDDTPAFEKAIQAAADAIASPGRKGASLVVPASLDPYLITRPLYLPPNVSVRGDGRDASRVLMSESTNYPVFVVGVNPPDLTGLRPDLLGQLDTTAEGGRGLRGFDTSKGHTLQLDGQPAFGPRRNESWSHWRGVTAFTVALAFVQPPTQPGRPVVGLGDYTTGTARPWLLVTHPELPGWYRLYVATTASGGEADRSDVTVDFPAPGARRLAVAVDLVGRAAYAWADGGTDGAVRQVAARIASGPIPPGLSLRPNDDWPLVVGGASFVLAGLHVDEGVRFRPGKAGDPPLFADGQGWNDSRVLFRMPAEPSTVLLLPLDDPADRRWLRAVDSLGYPTAVQVLRQPLSMSGRQSISGLGIQGRGPGVLLGSVGHFTMSDCVVDASMGAAVGSVWGVISYPTRFTRCQFGSEEYGSRGGVRLFSHIATFDQCSWAGYEDTALLVRGTSCVVRDPFFWLASGRTDALIRFLPWSGLNTPGWRVEGLCWDCEGGDGPTAPVVEAWQTPAEGAVLELDRVGTGQLRGPSVRLRAWPGAKVPARYRFGFLTVPGSKGVVADPGWLDAAPPAATPGPPSGVGAKSP